MKRALLSMSCTVSLTISAQVFDNGNLNTGNVSKSNLQSPANYSWSELQNNSGNFAESNATAGVGATKSDIADNFIADDFVVPEGQIWEISAIDFFAYQSRYEGSSSPFNGIHVSIFKGDPSAKETNLVFGDDTSNKMLKSTDAMIFRILNSAVPTESNAPDLSRKIWKTTALAPVTLTSGTYWLKYQLSTKSKDKNGFSPTVTIPGSRGLASFNAKQYDAIENEWTNLTDDGTPLSAPDFPIDIPFVITFVSKTNPSETLQYDNRVQVYPNPVTDYFQISNTEKNAVLSIEIVDSAGKILRIFKAAEKYFAGDLPSGNYQILIRSNESVKTAKFMKK